MYVGTSSSFFLYHLMVIGRYLRKSKLLALVSSFFIYQAPIIYMAAPLQVNYEPRI